MNERIEHNETLHAMIPTNRTLVIHLRTGDVIDREGNVPVRDYLLYDNPEGRDLQIWYTRGLPFYAEIWKQIQRENIEIDSILVVTGWHKPDDHSRSIEYINAVIRFLETLVDTVDVRINQNPDEDFMIMISSSYFVLSGGGFSKAIAVSVTMNGGRIFGYVYGTGPDCFVILGSSFVDRVVKYLQDFNKPHSPCFYDIIPH